MGSVPTAPRRLVVNADDFGFTRDVNEGIVEAFRNGILTSTTLMATGAAFEHAVELALANPGLDVGCHLVLVGPFLGLDSGRPLPSNLSALLPALVMGRIRIYEELAAQVRRIRAAGISPTHLDTHKHTHTLPPVFNAVVRIAEETGIRWIRRPFLRLTRKSCRWTDHFAGLRLTGRLGTAELVRLIHALKPGSTELMCHPGRCGTELMRAETRLKESRERELAALTAPEAREALRVAGVELVSFRQLEAAPRGG